MNIFIVCFLTMVSALTAVAQTFTMSRRLSDGSTVKTKYVAEQLILKPRFSNGGRMAKVLREASSIRSLGSYSLLTLKQGSDPVKMVAELQNDPEIEYVSLSPVPELYGQAAPTNDPWVHEQWTLWNPNKSFKGSINWDDAPKGRSDDMFYFVADTGFCVGHPDFDWKKYFWGANFVDPKSEPLDDHGHGCAVASIVASKGNNAVGILGMADFVNFGGVKVFDGGGGGKTEVIIAGLIAIRDKILEIKATRPNAGFVVNFSFGYNERVPPLEEAVKALLEVGATVVAAAGNNALNVDLTLGTPCAVSGVICVGASTWDNKVGGRANWASNWGRKTVCCFAPGQDINAAAPYSSHGLPFGPMFSSTGYLRIDGTSFAAPFVSGAVIMMKTLFPGISEEEIKNRLMYGNREMEPWTLNLRRYTARELSRSGARLDLLLALQPTEVPLAKPVLNSKVGHSSVELSGLDPNAFGAECIVEEGGVERRIDLLPLYKRTLRLTRPDEAPLQANSRGSFACRVVNTTGKWSEWSDWTLFRTLELRDVPLDLEYWKVIPGPIASEVERLNGGKNPMLWRLADIGLGYSWTTAQETLNYKGGVSDSVIVSPTVELEGYPGSVSIEFEHFLQMQTIANIHFDAAEVCVREIGPSGQPGEWVIVKEYLTNSRSLGFSAFKLDISQFAGKRIQIGLRFFTNGSSVGAGWTVRNFKIVLNCSKCVSSLL